VEMMVAECRGQIVVLVWCSMGYDPEGGPVEMVKPLQARVEGPHFLYRCMGTQRAWVPLVDWVGSEVH